MTSLAALVLAAGGSVRLGRPKQLLDWGGVPLLEFVVAGVSTWPVDEIAVVLGAEADRILDAVDLKGAFAVVNPEWEEGLASSLRVGLDALARNPQITGALIVLGDQPGVDADVVNQLVGEFETSGRPVVIPKYRYTRGNPVIVARQLWPRLMSLEGDHGAANLFRAHPEWVHEVWIDHLPPRDVDTEVDVAELRPRT